MARLPSQSRSTAARENPMVELINMSYCPSTCGRDVFNQGRGMSAQVFCTCAPENVLVNGLNRRVSHPRHLLASPRNPSGQTSTDKSPCWLPPPQPDSTPPSCQLLRFGGARAAGKRCTLRAEQENIDFSVKLEIVFPDSAKKKKKKNTNVVELHKVRWVTECAGLFFWGGKAETRGLHQE